MPTLIDTQHAENIVAAPEKRIRRTLLVHVYTVAGIVRAMVLLTPFRS
jgi:hypothetical protein